MDVRGGNSPPPLPAYVWRNPFNRLFCWCPKLSGKKRNPGIASRSSGQGLALISYSNYWVFQVARKRQTVNCGFYVMQDLGEEMLNRSFASSSL